MDKCKKCGGSTGFYVTLVATYAHPHLCKSPLSIRNPYRNYLHCVYRLCILVLSGKAIETKPESKLEIMMIEQLNEKFGLDLEENATQADIASHVLGMAWNNGGDFEFARRVFKIAQIEQGIANSAAKEYAKAVDSLLHIPEIFSS